MDRWTAPHFLAVWHDPKQPTTRRQAGDLLAACCIELHLALGGAGLPGGVGGETINLIRSQSLRTDFRRLSITPVLRLRMHLLIKPLALRYVQCALGGRPELSASTRGDITKVHGKHLAKNADIKYFGKTMTTSTQISETIVPDLDARTAKLAAEQLALVLQVRLLDRGVPFDEAARAAIRALPSLRDGVTGMLDHDDVIAIDLGEERGGRVKIFENMEAAAADLDLARHRHVAFEIGSVIADLITVAKGKTVDVRSIN